MQLFGDDTPRRESSRRESALRPVLGIFVNWPVTRSLSKQRNRPAVTGYMQAAAAANILAFIFSFDDVDAEQRVIYGWLQEPDGTWVKRRVPWPDVVYDQAKGMSRRNLRRARALRRALRKQVIFLNTRLSLGKWKLHRRLMRYRDMAPMLPHTVLSRSYRSMERMLQRHESILAKPVYGSRGTGISLIRRTGPNSYSVRKSRSDTAVEGLNAIDAYAVVKRNAGNKLLVLQERLPLFETKGRPCDIRMLMGKNEQGEWVTVSARLRVAQRGNFVTNTHAGAARLPLQENLHLFVDDAAAAQALYDRLQQVSAQICRRMEQAVGRMGEIGIDIALDKDLKLWLLEGNARPDKDPMEIEQKQKNPLIYSGIMAYTRFLWRQYVLRAMSEHITTD